VLSVAAGFLFPALLFGCGGPGGQEHSALASMHIPDGVEQVLLVTVAGWNDSTGTMQLFERSSGGWRRDGEPFPVVVGRNGLGWGRGLPVEQSPGPEKVEGDGRSPAGAFELKTAFGSAEDPPGGTLLPYTTTGANDFFVDDPDSPDYNTWVRLEAGSDPGLRWRSFERMARGDRLYELGIVVAHNMSPVVKGKGSAIFLHVWRSSSSPTSGCTAMRRDDLLGLFRRLDPSRKPLLIQIPRDLLDSFRIR
jgi:L,D-peptidoglycan transpeptidase YkuD (ErfK/YbiS/YcfS/YnhG family)